jgi:hypothetical protein
LRHHAAAGEEHRQEEDAVIGGAAQSAGGGRMMVRHAMPRRAAAFARAAMLAMLAFASIQEAAAEKLSNLLSGHAVTIRHPSGGPADKYPLDVCYNYGRNCGDLATHGYCRKKGLGRAVSHKTAPRRETWVQDDQRVCKGAHCVAIIEVSCQKIEGIRVEDPEISGREFRGRPLRADNCRLFAKDCGQGGALAFCRSRNFPFVRSFRVYDKYMGPTYVLGARQICENQTCRALSFVECFSTLQRSN